MRIRSRTLLAVAAVVCAAVAIGVWASRPVAAAARDIPPPYVVRLARCMATANGDGSPVSAVWARGGRARLVSVAMGGDRVDGNGASYLVVLGGRFVDYNASVPLGAPAPRGRLLIFAIDVRTRSVTDIGVTNVRPDLSSIGGGHPFSW